MHADEIGLAQQIFSAHEFQGQRFFQRFRRTDGRMIWLRLGGTATAFSGATAAVGGLAFARAMVLGVLAVALIYVAMNVTYVYAMPVSEIAKHETIAHAAAAVLFSPAAAIWLSAMIALCCFSAAATCTLSGARVYLAMAQDGVFFERMAQIHPRWRTPTFSLIGQGIWSAVLTLSGRYDQLYTYVIFGMVLSYTLTVIALFVLRWKRPDIPRPYRCAGYPWLPAVYIAIGVAWTLNTIVTRPTEALAGAVIIVIGVPGYLYWKRKNQSAPESN